MASTNGSSLANGRGTRHTRVVMIDPARIQIEKYIEDGEGISSNSGSISTSTEDEASIKEAAALLCTTDFPVAFPTETVYGLGADAIRSAAVQGIYRAKRRPADNPLIVHVSSPSQIRHLFQSSATSKDKTGADSHDPIPQIYHSLIQQYWPGPLTILLPLPNPSPFAPEVSAGLSTVGIRMPASPIALALIQAAGVPLAAPSANASTKPSPTTAAHVLHDLDGRIDLILDGGPCTVGVESTVVDGLHDPPLILRPGGISIEMLRRVPGWEKVQVGYEIRGEKEPPRAPGMKYKHYSPRARVILFKGELGMDLVRQHAGSGGDVGILRTSDCTQRLLEAADLQSAEGALTNGSPDASLSTARRYRLSDWQPAETDFWDLRLGSSLSEVAKGLFSALRAFDTLGVSVIFVESVDESQGDEAAAIMNRLRKAAENGA